MDWINEIFLLPVNELWIVIIVVFAAFIIFGMSGFGTALVASPLLAIYIPVAKMIPMLALMDFVGATINFLRDRNSVVKVELYRLVPVMMIGSIGGAFLLLNLQSNLLILLLGCFAIGFSAYSFICKRGFKNLSSFFSIPFGLIGGVFSALFGSGGFIYMMYLSSRLNEKQEIRTTLSVLLSFSTLTRSIIFLIAGVYLDLKIVYTAIFLLIPMIIGIYIGRHITLKLTHPQFKLVVNCIILASGITLLVNYFI